MTVPEGGSFFRWAGRYANVGPARIELPRAGKQHRFRFEAVGGGWLSDPEQLRNVRVQLDRIQDGERQLMDVGPEAATATSKLVPGQYIAEHFGGGKRVAYLPLVIAEDSPEELEFRLPQPVTYRGRVVRGIGGEGVSGAIVIGWYSSSRNNLALLTADDWTMLRDTPSNPPADHPAMKRLREFYGVQALVRTDRDGRFEITRQPDQEFYGILAFAEGSLPFKVYVAALAPDDKHQIDVREFPLFPAAKIVVRPVFDGGNLAVSPRWQPTKEGQPDWFARFEAAAGKNWEREIEYVHWLALNEAQPVFVPADVRLQVRFETPYDEKWDSAVVLDVHLKAGEIKEFGDVQFAANLPVAVRVVDPQGKPVEGAPVRQFYPGENAWSVAHNTDREGLARFHAPRNAEGQFRVSDLPGPREVQDAENLRTRFKLGDQPPAEPVTITITEAQSRLLLGKKAE
jgi:hypothetical protein